MPTKQYALIVFLSVAAGLFSGLVAVNLLTGQPAFAQKEMKAQEVVASRFVLKDSHNRIRAELALERMPDIHRETVGLSLYSANGRSCLQLRLLNDFPMLAMYTTEGEMGTRNRATFYVDKTGMPALILRDREGNDRTVVGSGHVLRDTAGIETRQVSSIVLFDDRGRVIWSAP